MNLENFTGSYKFGKYFLMNTLLFYNNKRSSSFYCAGFLPTEYCNISLVQWQYLIRFGTQAEIMRFELFNPKKGTCRLNISLMILLIIPLSTAIRL